MTATSEILVYRCAFAAQHTEYQLFLIGELSPIATFRYKKELKEWVKDRGLEEQDYEVVPLKIVEPEENALHSAKHMMQTILSKFKTNDYRLFLTGKGNFREELVDYYKANRVQDRPVHYQAVREYLIKYWDAIVVDGQEADDAMAQYQWLSYCTPDAEETVICTIDKDLQQIPGWNYNFVTEELKQIDEDYADYFFYKQLLTGDPVDNIKGIPGIGEKKAEELLAGAASVEDRYREARDAYTFHYAWNCKTAEGERRACILADKMLNENAQLLWIRRQEGVAWQPPIA